jgi:hypothetical protein
VRKYLSSTKRFSKSVLAMLDENRMMGIRAGAEHKFTGIWVVVVKGRAFIRSWNNKNTGWYREFLENPVGAIQIGKRKIRIRVRKTRGERLLDAIHDAYTKKYHTAANRYYVRGFEEPRRRKTTLELLPL